MQKILITPKSKTSVAFLKKLLTSLSEVEGIEMVNIEGKSAPKVGAKKVATTAKKTTKAKPAVPTATKAVAEKAPKAPKTGKKDEQSKKKSKKKGK